jgi:hypothetical protein
VVAACSVVALVRRRWRGQAEALLFGVIAVGLVVLASATTMYDVRYGFQLVAMLPVAAVLAVLALRTDRPAPAPDDPVEEPVDQTASLVAVRTS